MSRSHNGDMRTTVRLDEGLLIKAKQEARRRGETLTSLMERGLRLAMARGRGPATAPTRRLPVSKAAGGTLPGVDIDNSADLLDRLDGLT